MSIITALSGLKAAKELTTGIRDALKSREVKLDEVVASAVTPIRPYVVTQNPANGSAPSLRPTVAQYSLFEPASRLPFGSLPLGLDPFSNKELALRHRRREGPETTPFGWRCRNVSAPPLIAVVSAGLKRPQFCRF
jgi:hypothetical protein